jgi:hypothetical protein
MNLNEQSEEVDEEFKEEEVICVIFKKECECKNLIVITVK